MKRLLLLLLPAAALAAVWPEQIGAYRRAASAAAAPAPRALWDEYGFQEGEKAQYESDKGKFTATAYRLQDPTGAMAAFQWQRPAGARPSRLAELAVETPDSTLMAYGNYLFVFEGYRPSVEEITPVLQSLKNVDTSALPVLTSYLPSSNLVPNSERYVLGPEALDQFEPRIPPSVAAFHMGAEAQLGRFRSPGGELKLAIFNYPTPQIAAQRAGAFQNIPEAMVKRSGPLVALVIAPPDPDAAERLLALIRYQAAVTMSEYVPTQRDNIGDLVVNAFVLTGILLVFCTVAGLVFAGARLAMTREQGGESMIQLHLRDR